MPVETGENRLSHAEVSPAEVRAYVPMLLSRVIPGSNSLFQDCQMLFIRHRLSPAAPRELPRHISREREGMQQLSAASYQLRTADPSGAEPGSRGPPPTVN
jgi:hypothetical protein